ncbi:leucine-twenty homeobox [Cricetulus griseus]|nr:leucine-twenty homeobox [Cricetulus griseus]
MKSLKDDEIFAPKADCAQLLSTSGSDNSDQEPWKNFGTKQPEESGASVGKYEEYSELSAIYQSSLGLIQPPSMSMPFDIDMLVKMYNLPEYDDPQDIDKYFYSGCLD